MDSRKQKLRKFLEDSPEDVFLWYALAMEEKSENLLVAKELLQKCLQLNPMHIPSFYQLALIEDDLGQEAEAIAYLEKGLLVLKDGHDKKTEKEFLALRSLISGD